MSPAPTLDAIDDAILTLLHRDARRPLTEIAAEVNLTAAPVKGRIERLERAGVITGYTVVVDHANFGPALEAVVELRIAGDADAAEVRRMATRLKRGPRGAHHRGRPRPARPHPGGGGGPSRRAVGTLRRSGKVTGTKTLMVLDRWTRSSE